MPQSIEDQLRRMQPVAASIDRDQVIYEAGRREGRRAARPIAALLGSTTLASLILLTVVAWGYLQTQTQPVPVEPFGVAETPMAAPDPMVLKHNALVLRDLVLAEGVDALPSPAPLPDTSPFGDIKL